MLTTRRNLNLSRLSFDTEADELLFLEELETLFDNFETSHFVRPNTVHALHNLYLTLLGEKSAFELAFYNTIGPYSLLKDYFFQFVDADYKLPMKPIAVEAFISLAAKNQGSEHLFRLLQTDILKNAQLEELTNLRSFTFEQLTTFIDLHFSSEYDFSFSQKRILSGLINLLPLELFTETTSDEINRFLEDILPVFYDVFPEELTYEKLPSQIPKIAGWYQVWYRHKTKTEPEVLLLNDEYYQLDFKTIIKYVPNILWWQNGINFRNEERKFTFSSPEFLHLARGGSIRQALQTQPFSRPMAKVFSKMCYRFDQTNIDVYVYCYTKSLHTETLLTRLLQRFIGNYSDAQRMKLEFDKWRPIIQKLACFDFEELHEYRAMELLGYLTHVLRDKPDFTGKGKNLTRLLTASDEYYQKIREREEIRRREQILRNKLRREEEIAKNSWAACQTVKPLSIPHFKIIELTSRKELEREGHVMGHCVRTYADNCKAGKQSIWSLRELSDSSWRSRVTIALFGGLHITEARARFNALPDKKYMLLVQKWAEQNDFPKSRVLEDWGL